MTYDEMLMEEADKLLGFGNEYGAVIAIENIVNGVNVNEAAGEGYGDTGANSIKTDADKNAGAKKDVEREIKRDTNEVAEKKKFNNAIKALTVAASAVAGGSAATAVQSGGKTAGIVALASAVVTAAGALAQQVHDKTKVQKIKADSLEKIDNKLEDITVKLNTAGPGEKRDLLVARDALKKAKSEIATM